MATTEQFQEMIELFKTQMQQQQQQMQTVNELRAENAQLRAEHDATAGDGGESRYKSKKPDRPIINAGLDDREWVLFLDTWERYKTMVGFATGDVSVIRMELRTCCSSEVNKLLFEFVGPETLKTCSETQLLAHIKSVAVKVTDRTVHQMAFGKMCQNDRESIAHFVGRLKSQAFLCEFTIRCDKCNPEHLVNYSDHRIAERLIAGLRNQEHQRKILSEAATLITLDDKIKRLQIFETTDESATLLQSPRTPAQPSEAAASHSNYRKLKNDNRNNKNQVKDSSNTKCRWCGQLSHGKGKPMDKANCPASAETCLNCHRKGHLTSVCERSKSEPAVEDTHDDVLQGIPSESSVSFSFAADTPDDSAQDFRRVRRSTMDT